MQAIQEGAGLQASEIVHNVSIQRYSEIVPRIPPCRPELNELPHLTTHF